MRGTDKLMQPVRSMPLIRDRLLTLSDPGHASSEVIVVLAGQRPERRAAIEDCGATIVINADAATGMASSIKAGLGAVSERSHAALFMPADMPDITPQDIETLRQANHENPRAIIRAASEDMIPGNPVIFPRAFFAELLALTEDQSGRDVVKAHAEQVQLVPLPGQHARLDLDTPEAWEAWRAENPLL